MHEIGLVHSRIPPRGVLVQCGILVWVEHKTHVSYSCYDTTSQARDDFVSISRIHSQNLTTWSCDGMSNLVRCFDNLAVSRGGTILVTWDYNVVFYASVKGVQAINKPPLASSGRCLDLAWNRKYRCGATSESETLNMRGRETSYPGMVVFWYFCGAVFGAFWDCLNSSSNLEPVLLYARVGMLKLPGGWDLMR